MKYIVTTKSGYEFETDIEMAMGEKVILPPPEVGKGSVSEKEIKLAATLFGLRQEWADELLVESGFENGIERLPDRFMTMNPKCIRDFIRALMEVSGYINAHVSGKNGKMYPEAALRATSLDNARQLKDLLFKIDIKSIYVKDRTGYIVRTSGTQAYLRFRLDILSKIVNPKIREKMRVADTGLPLEVRIANARSISDYVKWVEKVDSTNG